MKRINFSLLFVATAISLYSSGMYAAEEKSNAAESGTGNIKFSNDLSLEDLSTGKKKVTATLWDFHGILGIWDREAEEKCVSKKFEYLNYSKFHQLKAEYPKNPAMAQEIMLRDLEILREKTLESNPKLKADFDRVPKGAFEQGAAVFRKHGYNDIADFIDSLAVAYKPRPGMESAVKILAALGIKQYLASNIAPHVYELVKNKFKKEHDNSMLDIILVGAMLDVSSYGPVPDSTIAQTKLVKQPKPSREFFQTYRNHSEKDGVTVFVDDQQRNIDEAIKHGPMIGVFLDSKDPKFITKLVASFNILNISLDGTRTSNPS